MSTVNGFGLLYYGWRHGTDGTATATKWLTLSWLPVIPVYRQRLVVLTDYTNLHAPSPPDKLPGTVDTYQILERLPLSLKEIAITLARAYILLPLSWFGPLAFVALIAVILKMLDIAKDDADKIVLPLLAVASIGGLLNFLYQCVIAVRKARGWQPSIVAEGKR